MTCGNGGPAAALLAGNPTNIIVAVAYQMSFGDYSRWMALPTLGALQQKVCTQHCLYGAALLCLLAAMGGISGRLAAAGMRLVIVPMSYCPNS